MGYGWFIWHAGMSLYSMSLHSMGYEFMRYGVWVVYLVCRYEFIQSEIPQYGV